MHPEALTAIVVIESRDLDTDARSTESFAVEAPRSESAQRAQLSELVARVRPAARLRSFGKGAASFLDSEHLVVARYESSTPVREGDAGCSAACAEQPSLFTV